MLHSHGYRRRLKAVRRHKHSMKGKYMGHKSTFWGKWGRILKDIGGTTSMAVAWLLTCAAAVLGWVWEALRGNVVPVVSSWIDGCGRGDAVAIGSGGGGGGGGVSGESAESKVCDPERARSIETRVVDVLKKEDLGEGSLGEEGASLVSLPSSPTTPILSGGGGSMHMHRDKGVEFSPPAKETCISEGGGRGRHSRRRRRSRRKGEMDGVTKGRVGTGEDGRDEIKAMRRDVFSSLEGNNQSPVSSPGGMWRRTPASVGETPFLSHQQTYVHTASSDSDFRGHCAREREQKTPCVSEGQDLELAGAWLAASMATANLGLDTYETDSQVVEGPGNKQMGSSRSIIDKTSIASAFSDVSWATSSCLSFTSSSLPSTSFSVARQHSSSEIHPVQSSFKEDTSLQTTTTTTTTTIISPSFQNIRDIWAHESEDDSIF